ncbi:MAG: DUF393 domain-containing protein [Thermoanaerobaculia bacterium]
MPEAPSAWVLYDDSCGFCRRWVPFWRDTLARRGIGIAPLQSEWALARLGILADEASQDLRLIDERGGRWQGADVYRYAMRRIGWTRPLAWLVSLPLLRNAFDWGYRTFARNRHRFSEACGLPGAPPR